MWRAELALLLRRVRIKALLVVLAAVPILVAVAVRIAGSGPDPGVGPRFLDQVTNRRVRRSGRAHGDRAVLPAPRRRRGGR